MRVLLIEDDTMLGKALVRGLKRNGLTVDWTRHGPDGHAALRRCGHAIALLDIGLPGMTGFEILKVAGASRVPPILVITARDWVEDMVAGLDLGADDYIIIKPFELRTCSPASTASSTTPTKTQSPLPGPRIQTKSSPL